MNFDRQFIDDLLFRTDIVSLIGRHVTLIPSGSGYKGLCPFHEEKTPSFTVNPNKQFFHCFGCGTSGDAIAFLKRHDNLSFYEAIKELAHTNGVALPITGFQSADKVEENKKQIQLSVLEQAANYYQSMLYNHQFANKAQRYLNKRQLGSSMAKKFMIGFAPPERNALYRLWQSKQDQLDAALELGLVQCNDHGEIYDQFRNRIIFPIRDTRGKVRGFGGRAIDDDQQPKYLNSRESDIFHKSNQLYGMYESLQARSKQSWLVTEGYMDVLTLHKHGFDKSVACLGTAINSRQIQWLARYQKTIYFAFDGDTAGSRAAEKTMHLCLSLVGDESEFRFIFFPENQDPDTWLLQHGSEALNELIDKESLPLSGIFIHWLRQQANIETIEGKAKIAAISSRELAKIPQSNFRSLLENELVEITKVRRRYPNQGRQIGRFSDNRKIFTPSIRNLKANNKQTKKSEDQRQLLYFLAATVDNREAFTKSQLIEQLSLIAEYNEDLPLAFYLALIEDKDKETALIAIEHLESELLAQLSQFQQNNHQQTSTEDMHRLFVQLQKHCYQRMSKSQKSEYMQKLAEINHQPN